MGLLPDLGGERSLENISRASDIALSHVDHRHFGNDHLPFNPHSSTT